MLYFKWSDLFMRAHIVFNYRNGVEELFIELLETHCVHHGYNLCAHEV